MNISQSVSHWVSLFSLKIPKNVGALKTSDLLSSSVNFLPLSPQFTTFCQFFKYKTAHLLYSLALDRIILFCSAYYNTLPLKYQSNECCMKLLTTCFPKGWADIKNRPLIKKTFFILFTSQVSSIHSVTRYQKIPIDSHMTNSHRLRTKRFNQVDIFYRVSSYFTTIRAPSRIASF